jgi:ubiquinone/menaquinone biosynthesis C-methylase UbiE
MKPILDACCGGRLFWFDKANKNTVFNDVRNGEFTTTEGRTIVVKPDTVSDFRNMPFEDCSFSLVVFDPPHRSDLTKGNWMDLQYGTLFPTWEQDLKKGFIECMRVLKPHGVLIFKWNEKQIAVKKVINAIGQEPLFGDKRGKTIWMTFMKFI